MPRPTRSPGEITGRTASWLMSLRRPCSKTNGPVRALTSSSSRGWKKKTCSRHPMRIVARSFAGRFFSWWVCRRRPNKSPSSLTIPVEDAFERVVDRLLSSPQFGERWGRHWLDLARYADSNGLDENFLFREAWRYRNWVIDAVNADLPYDRFLLEQIAGDLLPYDSIEQRDRQRIAAGLLVVGPKVLLGVDPRRQRMDVADEQLDTIGRAVLGQTLGCARCHDHKFDPIPTADYYALAGILTSTNVMEQRYMLGQQRVMERLVGLGPDGDQLDGAYEEYWRKRPQLTQKQKHAKSALEILGKGDATAFEQVARDHPEAVADDAADVRKSLEQRTAAQQGLVASLDEAMANPPKIPPRAMVPRDRDAPADEHVRLAGQFDQPGRQIPRGFLSVIGDRAGNIPVGQSGRLQLAFWLTDTENGAGHLSARVMANRVWHHLIGRGIVSTVDNLGRTGDVPSHPELLDHLARELIDSGWSLKSLVRQIVTSRTFAMSSRHDEAGPNGRSRQPPAVESPSPTSGTLSRCATPCWPSRRSSTSSRWSRRCGTWEIRPLQLATTRTGDGRTSLAGVSTCR